MAYLYVPSDLCGSSECDGKCNEKQALREGLESELI